LACEERLMELRLFTCEERLMELRLFSLELRMLRGILTMCVNT